MNISDLQQEWEDLPEFGECDCTGYRCTKDRLLREEVARALKALEAAYALAEAARPVVLRQRHSRDDQITALAFAVLAFSTATGDLGRAYGDRMSLPMVVTEGDEQALRELIDAIRGQESSGDR